MSEPQTTPGRELDPSALKGLAHPLRMAIYDTLTKYGPQTATSLAARLGESSGSTSYHLRQLARHRFIREVEGSGSGREKWWERVPGGVELPRPGDEREPAVSAAADFVFREWTRSSIHALEDFAAAYSDPDRVPPEWAEAVGLTTISLRLTPEQLTEVRNRVQETTQTLVEEFRGRNDPGSRPVQIQFHAFPLIDGEETPS